MSELDSPLVEEVVPGVVVVRTRCHSSAEDFEGERCPGCGVNYYDWLLAEQEDDDEDARERRPRPPRKRPKSGQALGEAPREASVEERVKPVML